MMNAAHAGDLKVLYIHGEDPVLSDADVQHTKEALENLEMLVVQECFLTDTAQCADVVLPAAGWGEQEGTFTSGERRVQCLHKAWVYQEHYSTTNLLKKSLMKSENAHQSWQVWTVKD